MSLRMPQEECSMPLDPSLVGHETQPETDVIGLEAVRQFADAIADSSAIYRDMEPPRRWIYHGPRAADVRDALSCAVR